jgi:predicted permease
VETLIQDFRFGLRMLAKSPGFTAVAVLTLALGIGANTAIFSLIDAVMLRSLAVRDPSQLVVFRWAAHGDRRGSIESSSFGDCSDEGNNENPGGCSFPYPVFEQVRSAKDAFAATAAFAGPAGLVLSGNGAPRIAEGEIVSGDYFSTFGVSAVVGRTLGPGDDSLSASPVVVLSFRFWQSSFGGDKSVVGRTISLNGTPFTIVGVADPSFTSLSPGKNQDLFLALSMVPREHIAWGNDALRLNNWWLVIMARLKPGVTLSRAQATASSLFRNEMLNGEKPIFKGSDDPRINLAPAQQALTGERGEFSKPLFVLMFAVGFILLIACANVAGLLLSRAAARQKEMAVRLALGAGGRRILRQLLTESVTLSLGGGALGILFAYWGVRATEALILGNSDNPFPFVVEPDWRVLAFTISVSVLTGVLFGLAPAFLGGRLNLTTALKENTSTFPGQETHPGRRFHLGKALVVIQVALSTIVLIGAGLFVRTLQNLHDVDPGFDTRNVLLFGIDPTLLRYSDSQIQSLYQNLKDQLAALPGVVSIGYSSDALLSGDLWTSDFHLEGEAEKTTHDMDMLAAGPDFFKTMRIPLLAGRMFTAADFEQAAHATASGEASEGAPSPSAGKPSAQPSPPVPVLVNATFVRTYFPNQNPLGKILTKGSSEGSSGDIAVAKPKSRHWEIIGVVGDTRYTNLRREVHPSVIVPVTGGGAFFELRTGPDPTSLIRAVRDTVKRVDSNLPLFHVRTQTERIEELLTQERVIARLASFFGLLALLLASIGLYGLLSYEVARRTREIGIRMALGAEQRDVTRLIILRGINLTLVGAISGVVGGLALTRLVASLLYGVKPTDPLTYVAAAAILAAVALLASYIPARRATKVDPMVALRYE